MSDIVDYMRAVDEERCNVEPWTVAQRCADAAAEITKLRAALREIDQQRYTGRNTINPDNAYEMADRINAKLLAVMDIARAALKEKA